MTQLTESVANLIEQLAKLPGIGRKSAERLTYHLLRVNVAEALALADAIRQVRENVRYCRVCFNLAEQDVCGICQDAQRDQTVLCVVEQPRDLMSLEAAAASTRGGFACTSMMLIVSASPPPIPILATTAMSPRAEMSSP